MLSSSSDALLKLTKTTSLPKMFPSDCITLYLLKSAYCILNLQYNEVDKNFFLLDNLCCVFSWEMFEFRCYLQLGPTGSCNDDQTVMLKMSSSYSIFKMSIRVFRISSKYAMKSPQSDHIYD